MRYGVPIRERILRRVAVLSSGCWEWQGARDKYGYGVIHITFASKSSRKMFAHRVSYEEFREPIPEGLVLDHLCRLRACVNPQHLEAITLRENKERGLRSPTKTHCKWGHEYTPENTYLWRGSRTCRTCTRAREAMRRLTTRSEEAC